MGEADETPPSSAEETLVFGNVHPDNGDIGTGPRKRKRPNKEKSKSKKLQTEADREAVPKVSSPYYTLFHFLHIRQVQTYDQSLLAVIGILDALKHESNVAGWIRSGQVLMPPPTLPVMSTRPELENEYQEGKESERQDPAAIQSVEVNGHEHGHRTKKRRVSDEGANTGADVPDSYANLSSHLLPSTPLPPSSFIPPSSPLFPPSSPSTSVPGLGLIGTRLVTPPPPLPDFPTLNSNPDADSQVQAQAPALAQTPVQWYEDPKTVAHWVKRGLNALDELGIEVVVGVDR